MEYPGMPSKSGAWNTYLDDTLKCLESSTASKEAWLRSLSYGCLNKSVGDKLRLYSYIRNLPTKVHQPLGHAKIYHTERPNDDCDYVSRGREKSEGYIEEWTDWTKDLKGRLLSVVVLEDLSKPPEITEIISPLLFTTSEFFNFIFSDNWGGNISLRLIGGELVDILLTALYSLERDHMVNSNVIHSNLNSRITSRIAERIKKTVAVKAIMTEQSTKGANESAPKIYEPKQEFVYETMNVEIIFYEKLEASNIPYIIQQTDNNGDPSVNLTLPRDISRFPYSLKEHLMNYVRIPESEDIDQRKVIEKLEAELENLKNTESLSKLQPGQVPIQEKSTPWSEKVEWIADDPYLIPENVVLAEPGKDAAKEVVPKTLLEKTLTQILVKTSEPSVEKSDLEMEIDKLDEKSGSKESLTRDLQMEDTVATDIRKSSSSEDSYIIVKSTSNLVSEDEEEPLFKRLNNTRNEMYVTNLYRPRIENDVSTQKKLRLIQQRRIKERYRKEQNIYQKLKENIPFDLGDRFKCLAAKKESSCRKSTAPRTEIKKRFSTTVAPCLWDAYSQEQEQIEMDSALINHLEKGVIERMFACVELKNAEKKIDINQEVKTKFAKNKNKNNPHRDNNSSFNSNSNSKLRETCLHSKHSIANNTKAINKSETKFLKKALTSQLKFPPIENMNPERGGRKEHKTTSSIALPPLVKAKGFKQEKCNQIIQNRKKNIRQDNHEEHKTTDSEAITSVSDENNYYKLNNQHNAIIIKEEMRQQVNSYPKSLHRKQNEERQHFNINQNRSTGDDNEADSKLSESGEDVVDQSAESFSESSSDASDFEEKTASDLFIESLKGFHCECYCEEYIDLVTASGYSDEFSQHLNSDYPPFLGRLNRDFSFLNYADYKPKKDPKPGKSQFVFSEITNDFVRDNILKMLDTMMIRKEIVTSNFGYITYVTLTFTRPEVLTN